MYGLFKCGNLYRAKKLLLLSIYFMPESSVYSLWTPHLKKIFQSQNASHCILLLVSQSTYSDSRTYGEPKKDIWRQINDRHPTSKRIS